jgi:hypothetical protein
MFTFKGGFISILDGYVNVDIGFIDWDNFNQHIYSRKSYS